jgi:hypothetical protein
MRWLLLLAGLALLVAAAGLWFVPDSDSVKTVKETSTVRKVSAGAETAAKASTETTTGATGTIGSSESPGTSTTDTATNKATTTTTEPSGRLTDAILAGILALGGALVLAGAFFDRITSIKAAGVEVGLAAKVTEKLAAATTPETPEDKAKLRAAYYLTLDRLPPGTSSGDDAIIEAAAHDAMVTVGLPTSPGDD